MQSKTMKVITVHSEKGGTGKTTISTLIAAALAASGRTVLLVDTDPQAHATISFGFEPEPAFYDVLVRHDDITQRIRRVPNERYAPAGTQPKGGLYLLPGNVETQNITVYVADQDAFADALEDVEHFFDAVVIDTSPSPGMLMVLIWRVSQYLLVPTQCEFLSLVGLIKTISHARRAGVQLMAVQPNLFQKRTSIHADFFQKLLAAAQENEWTVWEPLELLTAWKEASAVRTALYSLEGRVGKARTQALSLVKRVEAVLQ